MSERDPAAADSQAAPLTPPPTPGRQTAGAMLRQLREDAGVDAARVASAMKVPLQKLEALENDRLDELPDVTFARGLASAICRAFGADPAPVLERMPVAAPGLRAPEHAINQSFRRAGDRPTPMVAGSLPRPVLVAVGLLLLGAALLWWLPTLPIQLGAPTGAATPAPAPADGTVRESVEPVATEPTPAEMPAGAASAEQGAPATLPASAASAASPAVGTATPPPAAGDVLAFTATGETWVTVRDAAGKSLLNRALSAGETISLGGELPLAVTVGRKEAVTVTVRGKPFDHKVLGPSNVARFTVR
jgi:cytoskeleton protein RodZ